MYIYEYDFEDDLEYYLECTKVVNKIINKEELNKARKTFINLFPHVAYIFDLDSFDERINEIFNIKNNFCCSNVFFSSLVILVFSENIHFIEDYLENIIKLELRNNNNILNKKEAHQNFYEILQNIIFELFTREIYTDE